HTVEALEQVSQVRWERVQIAKVEVRDVEPVLPRVADRLLNRAVRRAPAHYGDGAVVGAQRCPLRWDVVRDPGDLHRPGAGHPGVVFRIVGNVPRIVVLLEPADAVLGAGCAWHGPRARQGHRVAEEGVGGRGGGAEVDREPGERRRGGGGE